MGFIRLEDRMGWEVKNKQKPSILFIVSSLWGKKLENRETKKCHPEKIPVNI